MGQAEGLLQETLDTIRVKLVGDQSLDESVKLFMTDDLLCNMITRFVFFEALVQIHTSFKAGDQFKPKSHPAMPTAVSSDPDVQNSIVEIATILKGSEYIQK